MAIRIDVSLDTNILLRFPFDEQSSPTLANRACAELMRRGYVLGTTVSNLAEFANVATRPVAVNGLGFSPMQAQQRIRAFEKRLVVFSESLESFRIWKQLVNTHEVRGTKVHDTRVVAIMLHSGIRSILTLNTADFTRFPEIVTLHPDDVLSNA
jgi:predicted nucleic acid-binding protein